MRGFANVWTRRGPLAWLLWPVSFVYGLIASLRRSLYALGVFKTNRVRARVIVVGNVVAGGAGKTPVVMALVMHLQARGWQVGVVSRGYGRSGTDCREVLDNSTADEVGDEPALVKLTCHAPVFVAAKRFEAASALLARYPETQIIVCDDGLQHHALHRDLEICVFDDRGTGNGFLLPAGPLREPWPRPTDLVLHTGVRASRVQDAFTARRALASYALRVDSSSMPLSELRGKPLLAVAAIAQPEAFFNMLRDQGLTLAKTVALPDHDNFQHWVRPAVHSHILVCTEKDAVKLWRSHPDALAVPLVLTPQPEFLSAVDGAIEAWRGGKNQILT
jgi:tetraacyldisaccharide 4'-kinase